MGNAAMCLMRAMNEFLCVHGIGSQHNLECHTFLCPPPSSSASPSHACLVEGQQTSVQEKQQFETGDLVK